METFCIRVGSELTRTIHPGTPAESATASSCTSTVHTCMLSIFIHTHQFCPTFGFNQTRGRNRQRVFLAVCQDCLHQCFKLAPKMNTQMAAVCHQSSSQPPRYVRMAARCDSKHCRAEPHVARSKVIQNNHIPSVHYTLPWKVE